MGQKIYCPQRACWFPNDMFGPIPYHAGSLEAVKQGIIAEWQQTTSLKSAKRRSI